MHKSNNLASSTTKTPESSTSIVSPPSPTLPAPSPPTFTTPIPRTKRPLAKRSCLSCRVKKARCELPDLFVSSSQDPVIKSKRCHRCSVLEIDCIVWDGDRKRKPKLPPRNELDQQSQDTTTNSKSKQETSWNPLSHLANEAETVARQATLSPWSPPSLSLGFDPPSSQTTKPSGASTQISSFSSLIEHSPHSRDLSPAAPAASSAPYFHPSSEIFPPSSSDPLTSSLSGTDTSTERAGNGKSTSGVPPSRNVQGDETESEGDDGRHLNQQPVSAFLSNHLSTSANKETVASQKSQDRTWTSVWRPIAVLVEYAAHQPQFTRYLAERVLLPSPEAKTVDLLDLIDKEECHKLMACIEPYLPWHPHLPSLELLYDLHARQPTKSTLFLLASMCVIAGRHCHPLSSDLMRILSSTVDRLGTQMLLSGTHDIYTVQALEILLAHEPSLIGTAVCGGKEEQTSRGNGLAGEILLTTALNISREIGLDKSVNALRNVLASPKSKTQEDLLAKLLVESSLWISLRIWEGHYTFVKSSIQPMRNLNELVKDAECMILTDEQGERIKAGPFSLDKFLKIAAENRGQNNDEMLRSADSMAKIQDITATEKQEKHGAASVQFKDAVTDMILQALQEMAQIEQVQQQSMTPFAWHPSAGLVEEWSKLESQALFSMLCSFGTCAIYTGQFDGAFSAKAFVEDLQRDGELRQRISAVGSKRMELSERLVASFSFFNRRLNLAATSEITMAARRNPKGLMEVSGAPIFLTCALVVDGCRLFLEGAAFVLMMYFVIEYKSDTKLSLMIQAAQRLDEFDGNTYSSEQSNCIGRKATMGEEQDKCQDADQSLSICRVAAKHVREMTETIQKWKLACSISRRRRIDVKERLNDDMRGQGRKDHTESQDQTEDSGDSSTPAAPAEESRPSVSRMAISGTTATQAALNRGSVINGLQHGRQLGPFPMNAEPMAPISGGRHNDFHSNSNTMVNNSHVPQQSCVHCGGQWPSTYPGMAEAAFSRYTQAPLAYLPQAWPQAADLAPEYGSAEQLLSGAIPDPMQHIPGGAVGGIYGFPLFDSFFEF
ncbi:hypothetical protein MVEG_07804 [Podila verticillata NRRL 6337]|nr:hypothetical protein MVEG_07804 [Podila verticillata NRRL 6337]